MNIVNKPGVKPYPPFLPNPPIFEKNAEFRDFLLTKCKIFIYILIFNVSSN